MYSYSYFTVHKKYRNGLIFIQFIQNTAIYSYSYFTVQKEYSKIFILIIHGS
jgi:hypothetical protein